MPNKYKAGLACQIVNRAQHTAGLAKAVSELNLREENSNSIAVSSRRQATVEHSRITPRLTGGVSESRSYRTSHRRRHRLCRQRN